MSNFLDSDLSNAVNLLRVICKSQSHRGLSLSEYKKAINDLKNDLADDFSFTFDGAEYRIIEEGVIWEIYVETIKSIVEDCYDLNLDKVPSFVALSIDWELTAKNAYTDGYGYTFSGYDGSEVTYKNYYIFRTN